jgi:galactokinase
LTFGTYLLADKRNDDKINFYSLNFPQDGLISTDLKTYQKGADWTNYPKGMLDVMLKAGAPINSGFDAVYMGNIPNGAGLSSSASIEVVTGVMLNTFFTCGLDMLQIALLGQKAENQFVGVNCGIMDQFIIAMGKKDNAVLLDCNTLRYTHVPVALKGVSILIANTNKRRELADSKYNERRGECDGALALLQQKFNIKALCDLTLEQLESAKDLIPNPVVYKRARHAVAENARTLKAVELLKAGEIKAFAKLMNDSHSSLRDDYEVTGKELDAIVAALQ